MNREPGIMESRDDRLSGMLYAGADIAGTPSGGISALAAAAAI